MIESNLHRDYVEQIRMNLRDFGETALKLAETFGKGTEKLNWSERKCLEVTTLIMVTNTLNELKSFAVMGSVDDFKSLSEHVLELMALRREMGF